MSALVLGLDGVKRAGNSFTLNQVTLGKGTPWAGQLRVMGRPLVTLGFSSMSVRSMCGGTGKQEETMTGTFLDVT